MDNLNEMSQLDQLQQAQADVVFYQHNEIFKEDADNKDINKNIKNVNEGIKNLIEIQKIVDSDEESEIRKKQFEAEMAQKEAELEFKQQQAEAELEFKKEQSEKELEFKKQQAEEDKKARKWDILAKVGIAIIPVIITSIFSVIIIKITCRENRNTLMATMLANEILERAGEISNVTAKDVAKEALKQATNVKIK